MALDDMGRAIEPPLGEGQKGEITLRLIFKGLLTHSRCSARLAREDVWAFNPQRAPCSTE
jgi:hypothetical protein